MAAPSAARLLKRHEDMLAKDSNWRTLWQELAEYEVPRKSEIRTQPTTSPASTGNKRTLKMYDSTAPDAVQVLSAAIHGAITSPVSLWSTFEFPDEELRKDRESTEWLQRANDKMYRRVQQSNFDAEIQEVYTEVVFGGTGAVFTDAVMVPRTPNNKTGFGGFRYEALPLGTYTIAEDEHGLVDTLFSNHAMTYEMAVRKFGDTVPDIYKSKVQIEPDGQVNVVNAVLPREGASRPASVGTPSRSLPWASYWIDVDSKVILGESGYHEFPYAVVRWTKQAREKWGRGPGEIALPDVRTLNEGVKLRLQGWATAVRPPMEAKHRGILGKISTQPGAVNYSREMGNLAPIDFGAKFDVANFNEQQLRERIQAILFIDKLQLPNKSIITATEAMERLRAMHRILGPTLGRMDYELLRRIVQRQFNLMLRAGEFDPIPAAVLQAAQGDRARIEIKFDGPIARAQRIQDLEAMAEFVGAAIPLREVAPEALDKIDFDRYIEEAAKATTMTKLLRSDKDVAAIRQARQEAQEQMAAVTAERENAKAAGAAAPAMKVAAETQAMRPGTGV